MQGMFVLNSVVTEFFGELSLELGVQQEVLMLVSLACSMALLMLGFNIVNEIFTLIWWRGLNTSGTVAAVVWNGFNIYSVIWIMRCFGIPFYTP